jgi:diguanylate cyclase (GGDEF)-like protein
VDRLRVTHGVTFSAGVARWAPGQLVYDALRPAEQALYQAKAYGGAQVLHFSADTDRFATERRHLFGRMSRMYEVIRQLHDEAYTDELTNLGNRRAMSRRMREVDEAADAGPAAAVIFVDIDRFGEYNKRHGDAAGDEVLGLVAETLALTVRQFDFFRKGGEEFVTFLPDVSLPDAAAIGERLRAAVEDLAIPHRAPGQPVVTITVGVAMTDEATTVEQALALAADRAFWLKAHGRRNSVLAAGPPPPADRSPDEDPPEGDAA